MALISLNTGKTVRRTDALAPDEVALAVRSTWAADDDCDRVASIAFEAAPEGEKQYAFLDAFCDAFQKKHVKPYAFDADTLSERCAEPGAWPALSLFLPPPPRSPVNA